jgi:hypothetical protein
MQAELEQRVLKNVQDLVQAGYIDGRPRHHQPDARNPATNATTSIFFVVTYQDFMELSEADVQRIFMDRHIVVTDVPAQKYRWDLKTLSKLGSLEQQREIQGKFHC